MAVNDNQSANTIWQRAPIMSTANPDNAGFGHSILFVKKSTQGSAITLFGIITA
jgi:hypothetical protein